MILFKNFKRVMFVTMPTTFGICCYLQYKEMQPPDTKFNLVFDLDNTLIDTIDYDTYMNMNKIKLRKPDMTMYEQVSIDKTENVENETVEKIPQPIYVVYKRPFAHVTLKILSKFNNVYLFTRSTQDYADEITKSCFADINFTKKLYKNSCNKLDENSENGGKDLDLISKNNIMLIDDMAYNNTIDQRFYHIPYYSVHKEKDNHMIKLLWFVIKEHCAKMKPKQTE